LSCAPHPPMSPCCCCCGGGGARIPGCCLPACGFALGWNPVAMRVIATSPSASLMEGFTTAPKMISALGSTSS